MSGAIRVVIADDERIMRDGLTAILQSQSDIVVVGTAGDGAEALDQTARLRPDVLMLDVRMPGRDGLWTLAELSRRGLVGSHRSQVVMLTTFDLDECVDEALGSGAVGFLLKSGSYEEIVAAVRAAARGHSIRSPPVTQRIIDGHLLALIGEGLSNAEIAARLTVSEHTSPAVQIHRSMVPSGYDTVRRR
jgi:DNA-binding NarL/FixJ family response regulator